MNTIELDIWKGDWGLASVDLDCLRVLTYVKFIGVPVKVRETNSPFFAPKGCLPVLRDGRKVFTEFDNIVQYLKSLNFSTDVSLNSKQQLEVAAFTQYLKEKLYPAVQFAWWLDEKNYNDMTRPSYGKALSFPFNFYYPSKYHSQAREIIDAIYGESHNEREIEHVVYGEAEKCLKDLSDKLGESEYFFGTRPSSFDATVFAYLAPILKAPFPNPALQYKLKSIANLSRFVARISQKNFRLISEEYASNQNKNKNSTGTQSDKDLAHFPNQTRNKILAALFAAIAMGGYALSNGLFQVNFKDHFERSHEYNDLFENEEDDN